MALYDLAVRGYMARVGIKRVLLCASALVLGLPAVASAAITLTIPSPTKAPVLLWTAGVGVGPYDVFRDPTCAPTTLVEPAVPMPAPPGFADPAFQGGSPLPDGDYCYRVEDPATDTSLSVPVTVDNVAPPAPGITAPLASSVLSGTVNITGSFSDDAVSGPPTKVLELVHAPDPPTSIGSNFPSSLDTTLFSDGTYSITARATDAAGNVASTSVGSLIIDNQAPSSVAFVSPPADGTRLNTTTFGAAASDFTGGSGIADVQLQYEQSPSVWANVGSADTSSPYSVSYGALSDGAYTFRLIATDRANHPMASATVSVILDRVTEPTAITSPASGANVRGVLPITFTNADASAPVVTVATARQGSDAFASRPGLTVTSATTASWDTSLVVPGDEGLWDVRLTSSDSLGNPSVSAVVPIRIDNTAPTPPQFGVEPRAGLKLSGAKTFTFTTAPSDGGTGPSGIARVELQVRRPPLTAWVTTRTRLAGPFTSIEWANPAPADECARCDFHVIAFDAAGNVSVASSVRLNVIVDNGPPVAPSVFSIDRAITNGPPVLSWTASPDGDLAGYKLVRDAVYLQGTGGLLQKETLTYTDNELLRDGSDDGAHGYTLTANDGGNDSSPKFITLFLDSVAPATPTATHAVRRGRVVDIDWDASADVPAVPSGTLTGVSRYVVRRELAPAVPTTPTSGAAACDVPANTTNCTDSTAPEGHTYRYAIFAVDLASNGSAPAAPPAVVIPDLTAPGVPAAFSVKPKGLVIAMSWRLPTAADLAKIVVVRNASRAPRNVADGKVVFNGKAAKASVKQKGGTTAWYRAFAVDRAGNISATVGVRIKQPVFRLFPENGSELRGTVRLTWKKPQRATYFNVQVYLGSKRISQAWPKSASFKIPRSKLKKGKTYTWYVWPGMGKKSAGRYGTLIGKSTFTYLG